jgi:sec-independent protein translocase protein TatB
MFDVSFSELMVIGVIALIVIGPERLPKVARTVGHLLGRAQRYVNDVKSDIQREIELDELRKFKSEMEDTAHTLHGSLSETGASLMEPVERLRDELDHSAKDAAEALSQARADAQKTLPGIPPVHDGAPAEVDPLVPSATLPLPSVVVASETESTLAQSVTEPAHADSAPVAPAVAVAAPAVAAPAVATPAIAASAVAAPAVAAPAPQIDPAHKPQPPTGTPS